MDEEKLIEQLIKEKGGTRKQYLSLLNGVAYHESAHTMDPTIKQIGGGPGRGKYQFEEGKNRGGITAARRTKSYLDSIGESTPKWLEEAISGNSLDATKLNSEQQDILFLGNMRMHPKADFSNYVEGKESMDEFWANYHWAGADKDREARLTSFNKSLSSLDPSYNSTSGRGKYDASSERMYAQTQIDNTFVAPKVDYSKVKFAGETDEVFDILPEAKEAVAQQQQQQAQQAQQVDPRQQLFQHINQRKSGELNAIDAGGSHEQNPNGGVPHGTGNNGQQNTVEEGETSFNFGDDKFIFSDRVSLTDYVNSNKKNKANPNQFAFGGKLNGGPTDPPATDPVVPPKPKRDLSKLNNLFFDFTESKKDKPRFNNPVDILAGNKTDRYANLNAQFSKIHSDSGKSCLAGAMNCSQDFVSKNSGLPGLRTILANNDKDPSKYKVASRDTAYMGDYVPNQSIDAWEVHDYMVNEGIGSNLFTKGEDTVYEEDSYLPKGFDYKQIPLGAVIGQGNSSGVYTNPEDGERSRHAITVVGFDNADGMPMVYDYGKLTRLDKLNPLSNKKHKINRITVPNEYEGMTADRLRADMKSEKERLGLLKMEPVNYGSDEPHIKSIEKGVNEVAQNIAYNYQLPSKVISGLANLLPGLSNKETKINNNEGTSGSALVDNAIGNNVAKPALKWLDNQATSIGNIFKQEGERRQDYELEIEAYEKYPNNPKKFKEYFNDLKTKNSEIEEEVDDNIGESSVGPFAIKDITEYAKTTLGINKEDMYGVTKSNEEELEIGSKAALSYLAESYTKLKEQYSDLSQEQLMDLTIISYNNKSKVEDPNFIKYYIKDKTLKDDYLEKIKGYKVSKKSK